MANLGLPVSDVVNVQIVMSPLAAQERNFGSLLILGDSNIIDTVERLREYHTIDAIASDFGTSAPEYKAAQVYFAQSPQPDLCYIGKWSRVATSGLLRGGILSQGAQALSNFTAVTTGSLRIAIDDNIQAVTGINFSSATNLNGVAAILQASLTGATVIWDANNHRFVVSSATTGTTSSVNFAELPSSGVDVAPLFGLRVEDDGYAVEGIAAETLIDAVVELANMSNDWYGLDVASSVAVSNDDIIEVASYIESASVSRIYGVTTQSGASLDSASTTDIAAVLSAMKPKRTFAQYSSFNSQAGNSIFGRAFTVNFDGENTTITQKFKQQPLITPETLTSTQAAALTNKHCNVFVKYNNDTAILQEGVMCNGWYFDEVHGTDWLQNDLQTAVYNLLYTSTTKIPQTDAGINRIIATLCQRLDQAVRNGLVAPGKWGGPAFGALNPGDTLATGYYVYAPSVDTQSQADREARKAPVIQIAVKMAGAVHSSDIIVNVNR